MKPLNPVKLLLASLVLLFNVLSAYSQVPCGFDIQHRWLLKNNSSYKKAVTEANQKVKTLLNDKDFMRVQAPVYRIPVVVHVIHNGEPVGTGTNISNAQIQSAINSLTQYYRATIGTSIDAELEFQLATLDPNCNPTSGIVRVNGSGITNYSTNGIGLFQNGGNELDIKDLSRWTNDYYNIWVVNEIEDNNGGGGIQGFAYPPGVQADLDGTVILANAFGYDPGGLLGYNLKGYTNLNTTLVHEVAHSLGLNHTFDGQTDINSDGIMECPANTDCSVDGDQVCDTDPQVQSNSNCPGGTNTCTGNPNANIVHNYMDYSSEACKNNFTSGQVARMRSALVSVRPALINSAGLYAASPLSPYIPPVAAVYTPATQNFVGGDLAGTINITLNGRSRTSNGSFTDNGYVNGTASCINLIQLFRGVNYTFSATIIASNDEQFGAWIDYNNDGDFLDANEELAVDYDIPASGGLLNLNFNFTVPGTAPLNTPVRLRIMDDLSTGYGFPPIATDADLFYGQAEDYPVYFSSLLPVVLHDFSGELKDNHSQLQWSATADKHSKGFDIERSYNGVDFKKIGYVPVNNGAVNQQEKYSFADPELAMENNYYRLKQWDVDNKFEYSNMVFIKSSGTNSGISVLNNPFNNYIDLNFDKPLKGKADIRLIDITGQDVFSKSIFPGAEQKLRIDLSGKSLLKGMYILEIRTNGQQYTQKLMRY